MEGTVNLTTCSPTPLHGRRTRVCDITGIRRGGTKPPATNRQTTQRKGDMMDTGRHDDPWNDGPSAKRGARGRNKEQCQASAAPHGTIGSTGPKTTIGDERAAQTEAGRHLHHSYTRSQDGGLERPKEHNTRAPTPWTPGDEPSAMNISLSSNYTFTEGALATSPRTHMPRSTGSRTSRASQHCGRNGRNQGSPETSARGRARGGQQNEQLVGFGRRGHRCLGTLGRQTHAHTTSTRASQWATSTSRTHLPTSCDQYTTQPCAMH